MSEITFDELKDRLRAENLIEDFAKLANDSYQLYSRFNVHYNAMMEVQKKLLELGIPHYELVDSECNSDELYSVVKFGKDMYVRFIGTYDSYGEGQHDYDNSYCVQVFPKQVEITIYE